MKRHLPWLLLPLYLIALYALSLFPPREDRPLLPPTPESWKASGNFHSGVPPRVPPREIVYSTEGDNYYWIVDRYAGDGRGTLESVPFVAPAWISLMVMGDLTKPANQVYFRLVDEDKRYPIYANADVLWRRTTHRLPSDWVGKPIKLVAVAGPRARYNAFGVGSPRAVGAGTLLDLQLKVWPLLPAFGISLVLFLLPGVPVATWLVRRGLIANFMLLPVAIVFSCVAGYLAFWAYFFNHSFGLCFGLAMLVGSAAQLVFTLSHFGSARSLLLSADFLRPLGLTALVGAFYLSLLLSVELSVPYEVAPRLRFLEFVLDLDNEIPYYLADSFYQGHDPRPYFKHVLKAWLTSDRPPLQAGLLLLQMPLLSWTPQSKDYALVASIAVQCAWVPAVLALWTAAGLDQRRSGIALLFVTLSGFALVNTVYTWPKMLAAALVVVAVIFALFGRGPKGEPFPLSKALLVGLAAALAALAHGGVAFTLLPLGLLVLLPRFFPGWSRLVASGAVFLAVLVPWSLYQKLYDPPGDRLLRQHLAGDGSTGPDTKPLLKDLQDAYGGLTANQIIENKLENLRVLFMAAPEPHRWPAASLHPPEWPTDAIGFRRCDFSALFWTLGLLNLGWPLVLAGAWRRSPSLSGKGPETGRIAGATLGFVVPALALASVAVWVVLMFGPAGTMVHQGSYATVLLLFAALAAWLTTVPSRLTYCLLALQGAIFAVGWLLTSPANQFGVLNILMIPVGAFVFVTLLRTALSGPADAKFDKTAAAFTVNRARLPK
jgi:hypothetical protein